MWKQKTLKKSSKSCMKPAYTRMVSVCFIISLLTTAYPVSTTFLNLQKLSGPAYTDSAFSLSITNSEAFAETLGLILGGNAFPKLLQNTVFHVFSFVIDLCSAGISIFFNVLRTVNAFFTEPLGTSFVFLIIGLCITFLYQLFVNYVLIIGEMRFFLEVRKYKRTSISKIFFLYKLRCIAAPVWVMFCRSVFQFLWNFTIAGGIIKHYEYAMIPYILAENPKISRKDAFFLSKQLMNKNKWRVFLLDCSFLGWKILSILTLGILDFIFVNPYITGCKAELYASLRRDYVLSRSPRYEMLSDSYLEHVPSEDELLISKALYDDSQGPYTKTSYFEPEQYPVFLFSVQPKTVKPSARVFRNYDILSCIFLFHAASCFGWITEMLIHLMRDGTVADIHLLFGPWLPLYGIYGIIILKASKRLLKKPIFVFFLNFIVFSFLQYIFSFTVELFSGYKLWDFSEFFLNINGRIYLGGSAAFALLGCAFIYYLAPNWTNYFSKLSKKTQTVFCVILNSLFITDVILTLIFSY